MVMHGSIVVYCQTFAIILMLDQLTSHCGGWALWITRSAKALHANSSEIWINLQRLTQCKYEVAAPPAVPEATFNSCSVNQVIVPSWQLRRTLVTMVLDAERLSINLDRHIGINSFTDWVGDSWRWFELVVFVWRGRKRNPVGRDTNWQMNNYMPSPEVINWLS